MLRFHLIFIFKTCDTDKARLGLAVSGALGATSGCFFFFFIFFFYTILFYIERGRKWEREREKDSGDRRGEKKMVGAEASRSI